MHVTRFELMTAAHFDQPHKALYTLATIVAEFGDLSPKTATVAEFGDNLSPNLIVASRHGQREFQDSQQ